MTPPQPHVLILPLPLQGPVNSTFKLAELLCLAGLHVTFLVTENIHDRLLRHTNIQAQIDCYPAFQLKSMPDGLPADHPRSGDSYMELIDSLNSKVKQTLKDMLTSGYFSPPIKFIISDEGLVRTCDVANEIGIPIVYFQSISPSCIWVFQCIPKLIQAGELPFSSDDDLDGLIKSVPGMESFLRRRDLPPFCRLGDIDNEEIRPYKTEVREYSGVQGLILNTFEELDGSVLSRIRSTVCPNLYTVGPIHELLKSQLSTPAPATSSSLWKEDRSCLQWLDSKPPKSVIYVSFGSIAKLTTAQLVEFWFGLVHSGVYFLWVIRPDSVTGEDWESEVPAELRQANEKKGCIVEWAPQEEVLAHMAVGGFLTHSGWNSTLESIYAGVPMISWPYFFDQQVSGRFVSEVWKLGLDMKDTCDRSIVEKMVREVMEVRKQEFSDRATAMAESAKTCLMEGGSSYCNLDRLVKDIRSIISQD